MADEDHSEKPTDKRIAEAREKGQFARAPELGTAAGLLVSCGILKWQGPRMAEAVGQLTVSVFGHLDARAVTTENVIEWARQAVTWCATLMAPIMGGVAAAGILTGLGQSRFAFTTHVLSPDLEKLSPIKGFSRVFSLAGLVRLGLDFAKITLAGAILYGGVKALVTDPVFYTPVAPDRLIGQLTERMFGILTRIAITTLLLGGVHFFYQHRKLMKDLGMSKQEIKDEMREASGDPMVKVARRNLARRMMQKQMMAAVPTADVVVTNPTHYAVALKYEREKDDAPMVLAKGTGAFAQRIKTLAAQYEVPTVENKPVAQTLYKYGKVGEAIPAPMYRAVAEILGFVYRTHRYYFHQLKARRLEADRKQE